MPKSDHEDLAWQDGAKQQFLGAGVCVVGLDSLGVNIVVDLDTAKHTRHPL